MVRPDQQLASRVAPSGNSSFSKVNLLYSKLTLLNCQGWMMADRTREQIEAMRKSSIGRLFLRAHRAFSTRATTLMHDRGHNGLSVEHTTLLAHIDIDGTHITTLAERAGITKQS